MFTIVSQSRSASVSRLDVLTLGSSKSSFTNCNSSFILHVLKARIAGEDASNNGEHRWQALAEAVMPYAPMSLELLAVYKDLTEYMVKNDYVEWEWFGEDLGSAPDHYTWLVKHDLRGHFVKTSNIRWDLVNMLTLLISKTMSLDDMFGRFNPSIPGLQLAEPAQIQTTGIQGGVESITIEGGDRDWETYHRGSWF